MVETEASRKILNLCKILLKHKKDGKIIHGALVGAKGDGKTWAVSTVVSQLPPVFYVKIPEGEITKTALIRKFSLAMGAGSMRSYDLTMDLMKGHIEQEGMYPLFILDEAQRLLNLPGWVLSELKDWSEDPDLRFTYLFLGDKTLKKLFKKEQHSIVRRIIYREELSGSITKELVEDLMKEYGLSGDPEPVVRVARREKWKLLELDNALYLHSLESKEVGEESLRKVISKKGVALCRPEESGN